MKRIGNTERGRFREREAPDLSASSPYAHGTGGLTPPRSESKRRNGAILVFAMIALLVVSMIGASLLRTALISAQQIRHEQQHLQANWLADAGCQRAMTRLRLDPEYKGEDWSVPAPQLTSALIGRVQITVVPDPESDSQRLIKAVAEYPQNSTQQIRASKQLVAPRPKEEAK